MSARRMTLVLGTAAGAFLAAGLISLATSPVAHADDGDGITIANPPGPDSDRSPAADPGFISATDPLLALQLASPTRVSPTRMNILKRWLSTSRLSASAMC